MQAEPGPATARATVVADDCPGFPGCQPAPLRSNLEEMKTGRILAFLALALVLSSLVVRLIRARPDAPGTATDYQHIVTILTYSSLGSDGGFLSKVKAGFEAQSGGCSIQVETTLGANQIQSYLEEPRQQERIDVVMGVDEILFARSKQFFYPLNPIPVKYQTVVAARAKDGYYPTDHAALSMIYRKADFGPRKLPVPRQLKDLLDPRLKGKFIVQDPRVSSPGLWFFLFTDRIVKTEALAKQWLSVAPSWDASYKMFAAGEAPMVWSYVTSLAYHASQKQGDQYAHVEFAEGLPVQVEGLAVVNRSGNPYDAKPCVRKWVEYVLSPAVQTRLSETQFMLPAVEGAPVPEFLKMVPVPARPAVLDLSLEKVESIVNGFGRAASR